LDGVWLAWIGELRQEWQLEAALLRIRRVSEHADNARRFDQSQYAFLKQCSEKGEEGIREWNEWRRQQIGTEILLEGADLSHRNLRNVDLSWGHPKNPRKHAYYGLGHFAPVHLKGAFFDCADVRNARFGLADLQDSNFMDARLEGTHFESSNLSGAYFAHATVDGATLFWECQIGRYRRDGAFTDFSGVAIENARIDPGTRELLRYNIRRLNWKQWYVGDKREKPFGKVETKRERASRIWRGRLRLAATWPVRCFWSISDYGLSTGRIVATFFISALVFAAFYYIAAIADPPGVVNSLLKGDEGVVPGWLLPVRAIYFSVVTMTTLGFGDMHANCQSFWGHVLLTLQVLLGYVLLGALVTRFAVLFTAGGPAGRFVEHESKKAITEQKAGESN
jgi:hypothetical protein